MPSQNAISNLGSRGPYHIVLEVLLRYRVVAALGPETAVYVPELTPPVEEEGVLREVGTDIWDREIVRSLDVVF